MLLSIITINRNNSEGLKRTMNSVLGQTVQDFEYIIIDGNSNDNSVDVINQLMVISGKSILWVSEPDNGIYDAMNKGIKRATGKYLQFLNSGDCLASSNVIEKMFESLKMSDYPGILYGNMLKDSLGIKKRDRCFAGKDISFLDFYLGTLNHSPAYIQKRLFDKYGLYDDSLRIVSDWKWYLQVIIFGGEKPVYTDIDVTVFDMNGISETNKDLNRRERKRVLKEMINPAILSDYDEWAFSIPRIKRIKYHPWAYRFVRILERVLFKYERWHQKH